MDQRGSAVRGLVAREPGHHRLSVRDVRRAGPAIALGPSGDLSRDVAGPPAEGGQAGGVDIDGMQIGQRVDRCDAEAPRGVGAQTQLRRDIPAQDETLDALHDIEVTAQDRLVLAVGHHPRDERESRGEGCLQVVLAPHVVGTFGLGADRRSAQHEVAAGGKGGRGGIPQEVGEVRRTATELPNRGYPG